MANQLQTKPDMSDVIDFVCIKLILVVVWLKGEARDRNGLWLAGSGHREEVRLR